MSVEEVLTENGAEVQHRGAPLPGEIWRHFKGGEYEFIGVAFGRNDKAAEFIYRGVNSKTMWRAKPSEWWELVPNVAPLRNMVPRFKLVKDANGNPV